MDSPHIFVPNSLLKLSDHRDSFTRLSPGADTFLKYSSGYEGDCLPGSVSTAAHHLKGEAARADEVRWLGGEVSKLSDTLTPAALPEQAGTGRHSRWRFWEA